MVKHRRPALYAGVLWAGMLAAPVEARVCVGNSDLNGSFAFVGSRSSVVVAPVGDTGTGGSGGATGSTRPLNAVNSNFQNAAGLVAAAGSNSLFNSIGVVNADGSGNLLVQVGTSSPVNFVPVGSYTVSQDCTVSIRFNTSPLVPATGTGGTGGTGGSAGATATTANFVGVIRQDGNEVVLVQSGNMTGTGLVLHRTAASACTNAAISGPMGLVGMAGNVAQAPSRAGGGAGGENTNATPVLTSTPVVASLVADGLGNLRISSSAAGAGGANELAGTYTVNQDCTGTARIPILAPGTSTPATRNVRFVVTQPRTGILNPIALAPVLHFVFTDANTFGGGTIEQQ